MSIPPRQERHFFVDNLLVQIHFVFEMIWWTGLSPWEFDFLFLGSLISTLLVSPDPACVRTTGHLPGDLGRSQQRFSRSFRGCMSGFMVGVFGTSINTDTDVRAQERICRY